MTAILYIWTACMSLLTSTGFGWKGNAAKGGMEIYTPVHTVGMCYVSCM